MPPGLGTVTCTYDQAQTLVCPHAFAVVTVDPASGQLLWAITDGEGGRKAPTVTAVWHGRVYASA
ncbi:hypothetical protein ABZY57_04570 [Streptomyces sp. NPDC006450]|uniref:hypothetical protein n=1 Tax=Streptomyces sp. NPDC006450 TaxID=3155458 RepID=UPI0033A7D56F